MVEGFYGKSRPSCDNPDQLVFLPLAMHCLDVAHVFRRLVSLPSIKARLTWAAGGALAETLLDRLAVLALLHDLGKANLGFQAKLRGDPTVRAGHLKEIGPLLFEPDLAEQVEKALGEIAPWFAHPDDAYAYLLAAWSHHGVPISLAHLEEHTATYHSAWTEWWRPDEQGHDPLRAVGELLCAARRAFPGAFCFEAPVLPSAPAFQHRFAGLVMLADWLGSHEAFFPIDRPESHDAKGGAARAVGGVGLDTTSSQHWLAAQSATFQTRFGVPPRPLQAAVDQLPTCATDNRLLVLEAETGSGKTEAALNRFFHLHAAGRVDSLYFALPTRVAAREIYERVLRYIRSNFPDPTSRPITLLAVPGYARVDDEPPGKLLPDPSVRNDDDDQSLRDRLWAAERPKRFLAAPVAVGTIDQALLSAVQTRHAHLRSVCLDRSLLVVDEVHASDAYMQALLERLLAHHVQGGGHALLLSATLGAHARSRLIRASGGTAPDLDLEEAACTPYPALTDLSGVPRKVTATTGRSKRVILEPAPWLEQPDEILDRLAEALDQRARVLVITNTVGRAIALQRAAEAHPGIDSRTLFRCAGVVCPHHGRFSPADREILDYAVSESFGSESTAGPLLLVGTQTLEQTLDIDADLLVTDLCPADVLLQRVGRLHRHGRARPAGCELPRCIVLVPAVADLETVLDARGNVGSAVKAAGLGSVYQDLRTLELTRRFLESSPELCIPEDNRRFVEAATHPTALGRLQGERWRQHAEKVDGAVLSKEIAAHVAAALYDRPFGEVGYQELQGIEAQTRLGLGNLRVDLDRPVRSPFGAALTEVVIPGHLAPSDLPTQPAQVLAVTGGVIHIGLCGREYRYSRFGLERGDD